MSTLRFQALAKSMDRKPLDVVAPAKKTSDYYGVNVFNDDKMKKYLSKEAYEHITDCINKGTRIDRRIADQIAAGMKAWAMELGATHYTHWFNPLTDGTAEKHDSFIDKDHKGNVFEAFSGKILIQQEPDASSFPNGGIRATFEARGYTAWDPGSPVFVIGDTLTIPTIFISYTGESLDYKTALLKSCAAVDKAAVAVCQYFDKDVTKVTSNLGWEQEYFLVDEALYLARPDLMLTERTLMGHNSAKNQQLEDHYFSSIPERVQAFMIELEFEAYKLGMPFKTRHNEVAPNQFELAPIYEEANIACDHNQLLMDVIKKIARKHNFRVLLHEKPFKGVNGSGKHCNWSLSTDTGVVLYQPGKNPRANLQFLTYIVNTLVAIYDHQDLMRASIVSAANEHRLGANEAPPAIISAFLGETLSRMLDEIENKVDRALTPEAKLELKLNIGRLPELILDSSDRNRTSPFAFTGNRFEFRAVGSSANTAAPLTVINTIVANQLNKFKAQVDDLINKGARKDDAILQVLRELIVYSKPVRFDGNGYSEEWRQEAARRGLTNISDTANALPAWVSEKSVKLFEELGVLSHRELESRFEVKNETYVKKLQIEGRVMGDLAVNHIIPTAIAYQTKLITNVKGLKDILPAGEFEKIAADEIATIKEIAGHTSAIRKMVTALTDARAKANDIEDASKRAMAYSKDVKPFLGEIREHIDALELIVDDESWPLPKYRELLFIR